MSIPIPASKPKASLSLVMQKARERWEKCNPGFGLPEFFVLAVRGYYSATIAPAGNNISAYDDAFFIVSPLGFTAWNGNTDPSRYGWNPNADKFMARLAPGCWKFGKVLHRKKYQAFGQVRPVTVERIRKDGSIAITETGSFGIHDHCGGNNGTSSEGCTTHPIPQWEPYRRELNRIIDQMGVKIYDFILIDGPIN
jgi:hypothetical protein